MTIDYDRNMIFEKVKEIPHKSNGVSVQIDELLLQNKVDYKLKVDLAEDHSFIQEDLMGIR